MKVNRTRSRSRSFPKITDDEINENAEALTAIHIRGVEMAKLLLHGVGTDKVAAVTHASLREVAMVNKWIKNFVATGKVSSNSHGRGLNDESSQGPPTREAQRDFSKRYEPTSPESKYLLSSVEGVTGVNTRAFDELLVIMDTPEGKSRYLADPIELAAHLEDAGVSWMRAENIVSRWVRKLDKNAGMAVRRAFDYADGTVQVSATESSFERHFDRMIKIREAEMMDKMTNPLTAPAEKTKLVDELKEILELKMTISAMNGQAPPPPPTPPDKFDKLQETMLINKILKDSGQSLAEFTPVERTVEFDPIIDEEGNEVKDKDGVVKTRRVVHERMMPWPGQQTGWSQLQQGGDSFERMMNRIMQLEMIKVMRGGGMGGMGGMMGPMGGMYAWEPVLDDEGKIVMNEETGQPALRAVPYYPGMAVQSREDKSSENALKMVEIMADKLGGKSEGGDNELVTILMERINQMTDKQMDTIRAELDAVKGSDPLEYTLGLMSQMKELGLGGGDGTKDMEVVKLEGELKKYMHDSDLAMQKWIHEQKNVYEDKKYARVQMQELSKTIRDAVTELGKPLAEGFRDGIATGRNGKSGKQAQSAPTRGDVELSEMSDEELLENVKKFDNANRTVQAAGVQLNEELKKRGLTPQASR